MELKIIETFASPLDALTFLQRENINIMFTDKELSDLNDKLAENLLLNERSTMPKFVFIIFPCKHALSHPIQKSQHNRFFFVDADGAKVKINLDDIVYVEGSGNYVKIIGKKHNVITHRSLTSIQEILPAEEFIRVHKSYIVAINFIDSYKAGELWFNMDDSMVRIPTGTTYRNEVLAKLQIGR